MVLVYFLAVSHQGDVGGVKRPHRGKEIGRKELNFVLILCGGSQAEGSQGGQAASDVSRQIRQADVMLKSAVLLTKR